MMEKLFETVKAHPMLFGALGLSIFLYFMFSGSGSSTASSGSNQSALTAAEEASISAAAQSNAQLMMAQDQVNAVGIQASAETAMNANNNASQFGIAQLAAQVQNGQTAAALTLGQQANTDTLLGTIATSAFNTAAANVTANYTTQVNAAGGNTAEGIGANNNTTDVGLAGLDYLGGGNIYAPDGQWYNGIYYPHGSTIPITTSAGNPADVQEFNGANFSIEQMFNNLISAVQGQGPVTTATVVQGSAAQSSNFNVDPMFLNINAAGQVNQITSVTPGQGVDGWTGSVVSVGAGQNVLAQ
jgi:hypothetical protein